MRTKNLTALQLGSQTVDNKAFDDFFRRRTSDFRRIARKSNGAYEVGDLYSEAWLIACEIEAKNASTLDLHSWRDQEKVLSWLYVKINKSGDLRYRFFKRPDAQAQSDEFCLWDTLKADRSYDPLERLLANEDKSWIESHATKRYSEHAAYWVALQNFHLLLVDLAAYLELGTTALKQRFIRAGMMEDRQLSLFDRFERVHSEFVPIAGKRRHSVPPMAVDTETKNNQLTLEFA